MSEFPLVRLGRKANYYPEAGKNASEPVQKLIEEFRALPDSERAQQPLLYTLLGSGTPEYKMSKEDSEYVDESKTNKNCETCQFAYLSVARNKHICSQISGYIELTGWCRLWELGKE